MLLHEAILWEIMEWLPVPDRLDLSMVNKDFMITTRHRIRCSFDTSRPVPVMIDKRRHLCLHSLTKHVPLHSTWKLSSWATSLLSLHLRSHYVFDFSFFPQLQHLKILIQSLLGCHHFSSLQSTLQHLEVYGYMEEYNCDLLPFLKGTWPRLQVLSLSAMDVSTILVAMENDTCRFPALQNLEMPLYVEEFRPSIVRTLQKHLPHLQRVQGIRHNACFSARNKQLLPQYCQFLQAFPLSETDVLFTKTSPVHSFVQDTCTFLVHLRLQVFYNGHVETLTKCCFPHLETFHLGIIDDCISRNVQQQEQQQANMPSLKSFSFQYSWDTDYLKHILRVFAYPSQLQELILCSLFALPLIKTMTETIDTWPCLEKLRIEGARTIQLYQEDTEQPPLEVYWNVLLHQQCPRLSTLTIPTSLARTTVHVPFPKVVLLSLPQQPLALCGNNYYYIDPETQETHRLRIGQTC